MSGAVADVACGYAALTLFPPGSNMLAVEYAIHFLEPALGDELIGRAEVIRAGGRLIFCRCDIFVQRDGVETLCGAVLETVTGKRPA
jgi:acyl-coenzyme A thioesterase PaaI-like protein